MKNSYVHIFAQWFWTGFGVYLAFFKPDFHGALLCFVMSGIEQLIAENCKRKEELAEAAATPKV